MQADGFAMCKLRLSSCSFSQARTRVHTRPLRLTAYMDGHHLTPASQAASDILLGLFFSLQNLQNNC